jgi:hypothetical protein
MPPATNWSHASAATPFTDIAGRIIVDDWPTGVTVIAAQQHGGPYPATTAGLLPPGLRDSQVA